MITNNCNSFRVIAEKVNHQQKRTRFPFNGIIFGACGYKYVYYVYLRSASVPISSKCSELQGLPKKNIMDSVFHALILCKIRYALCAWGGHITEAHKGQIAFFCAGCIVVDM